MRNRYGIFAAVVFLFFAMNAFSWPAAAGSAAPSAASAQASSASLTAVSETAIPVQSPALDRRDGSGRPADRLSVPAPAKPAEYGEGGKSVKVKTALIISAVALAVAAVVLLVSSGSGSSGGGGY